MTEDWAEIRRLHRSEQMSIEAIVGRTGLARNTVRAALASDAPPRYLRGPVDSIVDSFEVRIRALLAEFPSMPATVIAERIGWEHSSSVLRAAVAELRPLYAPGRFGRDLGVSAATAPGRAQWRPPWPSCPTTLALGFAGGAWSFAVGVSAGCCRTDPRDRHGALPAGTSGGMHPGCTPRFPVDSNPSCSAVSFEL